MRHPVGCAHCVAVRRPHPVGCAHCVAVSRPHRPRCGHCRKLRALAADFAAWRHAAELAREEVCLGYAAEEATYGDLPTFPRYLSQLAA